MKPVDRGAIRLSFPANLYVLDLIFIDPVCFYVELFLFFWDFLFNLTTCRIKRCALLCFCSHVMVNQFSFYSTFRFYWTLY